MKSKRAFGLTVVLASLAVSAIAMAAPTWLPAQRITSVWAGYTDKAVYVGGFPNTFGCKSSLVRFSTTNSDPEKVLSIATAAQLSGKRLSCVVDGCDGDTQRGYQCNMQD